MKRNFSPKKGNIYIFKLLAGFDYGLTGLTKIFGNYPCKETFEDFVKAELFNRIVTELSENNIENVATLILSYIKPVSGMLN